LDIDPFLLFVIIFLVAPLIERLLKGNKQQPPPRSRPRPQQSTPPQRPRPELQRREPTAAEPEGTEPSAADMVPDDLWAILTGEQRSRPSAPPQQDLPLPPPEQPRREPTPSTSPSPARVPTTKRTTRRPAEPRPRPHEARPVPEERPPVIRRPAPAGYDMRGELPPDEEAGMREAPPPEAAPVEGYVRELPRHAPPEIVSLEELVIDDEKRHETFQQRLAALPKAAGVRRIRRHELALRFRASDELRRAVIMSEVLGPPRGLD
jgi:hypothetical protein